jgi:integrase
MKSIGQHLRETVNQVEQPFAQMPRTYGQLCQHYIANELMEDQSEATIAKAFTTTETYKRHLNKRIIPRWGRLAPLAIESVEVEKWFKELKKGDPKKKVMPLADPTIDKIRRVMNLVYLHGQRSNFLPRQQEGNPMNWVRQRTTSSYQALIMTPPQAFEILVNIPEPRRTLALCDAATALRVSEILGLQWMDLDFAELVMHVRRAYVWGRFKEPKSKASKAPVPMHPLLAGFLLGWREKTAYSGDSDFVFASTRLRGAKPLSASILVKKYLRPAAVKAGVIAKDQKIRFGFHNFRHSLASALVKMKIDPKTVQEFLRQAHVTTTLQLYAQSDMESKRDAQGRFLEQLVGERVHLLTENIH